MDQDIKKENTENLQDSSTQVVQKKKAEIVSAPVLTPQQETAVPTLEWKKPLLYLGIVVIVSMTLALVFIKWQLVRF